MYPDIVFEEMKEEYLDEVLQMYSYYILNSTATFHIQVPNRSQMREMVFFDNEKYKTFVILDSQQICGYVFITQYKNREAYDTTAEVSVYLQTELVRKGIGSRAMNYIENYAKQHGIHVLLATICGQNEASMRLCAKNGYNKCAHLKEVGLKFGQLLDIVVYQKIIS